MSQRSFTALIVILIFAATGLAAAGNGYRLPAGPGISIEDWLLPLLAPLALAFTTLNAFYALLDARISDGSLRAGDILGLFSLSAFYTTIVSTAAAAAQIFNMQVLSPDTQTVLVNVLLLGANVLLRSFTNRPPGDAIPSSVRAAARASSPAKH